MTIKQLILGITFTGLVAALAAVFEPYLRTGTPYKEGSGEWVGYSSAKENGFKRSEECRSDPELVQMPGYVEGCERYF